MNSDFSLGSVEVALTPQQRFEEFLRKEGMRMTRPRRQIVDQVFSRHEHFDAEDLYQQLKAELNRSDIPGRATVYRTLSDLVQSGLLREMDFNGRKVYEHDYGYPQHDHLHCQKCDKLIEFSSDELKELRDAVAQQHQFRVTGHRFIVEGICADCHRQRRQTRRQHLI